MENLIKGLNETESQYIWRICSQKEILGYSWKQIASILNKNLKDDESEYMTESAYRKQYQQAKKYKEEVFDLEMVNVDDRLEEYEKIKLEAKMAIKEAQTERLFTNRTLREETRAGMIVSKTNKEIVKANSLPIPSFDSLQIEKSKDSEYLLGISDIHAYKIVKTISNTYDKKELERRMSYLTSELKEIIKSEGIKHLTILNGGDNIQNVLRAGDLSVLEDSVIPTVIKYRRWIAGWLKDLSKYVEITYIGLTESNHAEYRVLGAKSNLMARDNFELSIVEYIKDLTEDNDRIKVIVPQHAHYTFEMAGYNLMAHHGHRIGNVKNFIEDKQRKLRMFIDYSIFGHLHNESITTIGENGSNDVQVLRLPSIIGTDEYADSISTGAKASAIMWRFTKGRGKDRTFKIVLN